MKDLAEAIYIQRRLLKANQSEVARAAGVSRNYISQIERGNFGGLTINTLHKICRALNLQAEINIHGISNIPNDGPCPGCRNQPMEFITCQICGNGPKKKAG